MFRVNLPSFPFCVLLKSVLYSIFSFLNLNEMFDFERPNLETDDSARFAYSNVQTAEYLWEQLLGWARIFQHPLVKVKPNFSVNVKRNIFSKIFTAAQRVMESTMCWIYYVFISI